MLREEVEKASKAAGVLSRIIGGCNKTATAVESIVIFDCLKMAVELEKKLNLLHEALKEDDNG